MNLINVGNLNRSIFFPVFNSNNTIPQEATMNDTTALQLFAV